MHLHRQRELFPGLQNFLSCVNLKGGIRILNERLDLRRDERIVRDPDGSHLILKHAHDAELDARRPSVVVLLSGHLRESQPRPDGFRREHQRQRLLLRPVHNHADGKVDGAEVLCPESEGEFDGLGRRDRPRARRDCPRREPGALFVLLGDGELRREPRLVRQRRLLGVSVPNETLPEVQRSRRERQIRHAALGSDRNAGERVAHARDVHHERRGVAPTRPRHEFEGDLLLPKGKHGARRGRHVNSGAAAASSGTRKAYRSGISQVLRRVNSLA